MVRYLEDPRGNRIIVEIKPKWEEKVIGQLLRYKNSYSKEIGLPLDKIRIAVICSEEIGEKFLVPIKESKIEFYVLKINAIKLN